MIKDDYSNLSLKICPSVVQSEATVLKDRAGLPVSAPIVAPQKEDVAVEYRSAMARSLPFEDFSQENRSLDRVHDSSGLGLSLAWRPAGMQDGRIEAHNEDLGCGAEFAVRLPRLSPLAAVEGSSAEGGGLAPRPPALRILVVDDNVDSADSMALLLSLDGHEVRTAFDGSSALTEAAEFQPKAVLLDIGLPGMDGYEVARRLRELPGLHDVLMIAVTGYGQQDDRAHSKAAGFNHHLVKPVDPEHLSQLLSGLTHD